MTVVPQALVLAGKAAKVCGVGVRGDSSFAEVRDHGSVVRDIGQSGIAGVM